MVHTVNRRAILIGCSISKYGNLVGAKMDLVRFGEFLTSDYGGAWEPSELRILENPSREQVDIELFDAGNCGYVFVTFSGHGEHHESRRLNDTYLCLRGDDSIYVQQLNPGNSRQTIVVDACRKRVRIDEERVKLGDIGIRKARVPTDQLACRLRYDEAILDAEEGREVLYSCSIQESAGEDENGDGGVFSRALVMQAQQACRNSGERGTLYLPQAFELAARETTRVNSPQHPVYRPSRRTRHFPFAVIY